MLRYYVAPVVLVGSGYGLDLPAGVTWVAVVPSGPDGLPTYSWALALVDADDHAPIEALNGVISLGLSPDSPMSDVPNGQRNQYQNRLRQHVPGFTIDWNTELARDVADRLAVWAQPAHVRGALALFGGH